MDNLTHLTQNELRIAKKFRECCSHYGVEKQSTLEESASLLLELGSLYIEKAKLSKGMARKLGFIKSAALISGAKVRYQRYFPEHPNNIICKQVFREMSSALLELGGAKLLDADLLDTAEKISMLLKRQRQKEKEFMEQKLAPIAENIPHPELLMKQRERIQLVGTLLKENTAFYRAIMKYISEKCVNILGEPPCKFCVVGLGSLARDEVTLYSDFEHVILLEDGFDESKTEENKEHFRWFSVLFQVIVIGLGETYIPTVGVGSLNGLYSEDKSQNWYFDLYTPGGVSFDGRFPHSCKTPLGKQEPSVRRKHVVELIQPVENMLNYLTFEENKRNGYHLRDILLRTRLVYGDEDLHADFRTRSGSMIIKESRDQEVQEQAEFVAKNVNWLLSGAGVDWTQLDFEKIKDFLYRPVTVAVGCLSRICRRTAGSNLGFFSWFRKTIGSELTSDLQEFLHNLEYAVAVACEIRLKVYAFAGQQKQKMIPSEMRKFVGKQCLIEGVRTVLMLITVFRAAWKTSIGYSAFFEAFGHMARQTATEAIGLIESDLYKIFGYHEDALSVYIDLGPPDGPDPEKYVAAGISSPEKREEYFRKAEELCSNSIELQEMTSKYVQTMSQIYFYQARYDLCFDILEKWTTKHRIAGKPLDNLDYMGFQGAKAGVLRYVMVPEDILNYSEQELEKNSDVISQVAFRMSKVVAHFLLGNFDHARELISEVALLCQNMAHKVPHFFVKSIVDHIFLAQVEHGWVDDANKTLDLLDRLQGTGQKNFLDSSLAGASKLRSSERNSKAAIEIYKKNVSDEPAKMKMYGNVLGNLFLQVGISQFYQITKYFEDAPEEALHQPLVYKNLHTALRRYWENIDETATFKLGDDIALLFETFSQHFLHPLFIGPLMDVMAFLVEKFTNLRAYVEIVAQRQESEIHLTYDAALRKYASLEIHDSIALFWKVLHHEETPVRLRKKSCTFLAHMLSLVAFKSLVFFLPKHRSKFMNSLCFPQYSSVRILYNEAIEKYVLIDFESSATRFWKCVLRSRRGSVFRQRSIEMLMFTVVIKWERYGSSLNVVKDFLCL